jgi:hypothetical protein
MADVKGISVTQPVEFCVRTSESQIERPRSRKVRSSPDSAMGTRHVMDQRASVDRC